MTCAAERALSDVQWSRAAGSVRAARRKAQRIARGPVCERSVISEHCQSSVLLVRSAQVVERRAQCENMKLVRDTIMCLQEMVCGWIFIGSDIIANAVSTCGTSEADLCSISVDWNISRLRFRQVESIQIPTKDSKAKLVPIRLREPERNNAFFQN